MTLEDILRITRRRIGALIAIVVACLLLALAAAQLTPRQYTATSTAYVTVVMDASTAPDAETYNQANRLAVDKAAALVAVFGSQPVLDRAGQQLGAGQEVPVGSVTAQHAPGELTVTVSATASTPERAREVADEVVRQTEAEVQRLDGEGTPLHVVLMTSAGAVPVDAAPSTSRYLAVGVLVGLALGYLVILISAALDRRIGSADEAAQRLGVPALGTLPYSAANGQWRGAREADSAFEEELRRLRANLLRDEPAIGRRIVVTSPGRRAGRTTVALGLARVLALADHRVVLVEADMRSPVLAAVLGLDPAQPGVVQILDGAVGLQQAMVATDIPGLSVLVAGPAPDKPSERAGSARMNELLAVLARSHVVVIDTPAIAVASDSTVLAARSDGVVLVIPSGRTTTDSLERASRALERGGGSLLGVVVNRTAPGSRMLAGGLPRLGSARTLPTSRDMAGVRHRAAGL